MRVRVTRRVEVGAAGGQGGRNRARARCPTPETAQGWGAGGKGPGGQAGGALPGATLPPREPAGDDDERETERRDERRRDPLDALGCEGADQCVLLARQDRVEQPEHSAARDEPCKDE